MSSESHALLALFFALVVAGPACGSDETSSPVSTDEHVCVPQSDTDDDEDGALDDCDNCPGLANEKQLDIDFDGVGDACDDDDDHDGTVDSADNCPRIYNRDQADQDEDGVGDLCDDSPFGGIDTDEDGIVDAFDACPDTPSAESEDTDSDSVPDVCDNCPTIANAGQANHDQDLLGDACDEPDANSIIELTIEVLHERLAADATTCVDIVEAHLQRAWQFDPDVSSTAMINAITELNPDVVARARELDEIGFDAAARPLHCVPFVVKSNYRNTSLAATNGMFALDDAIGESDAHTVAVMREAGAVLLGTTTMDERASGVDGISSRGGRAGNAYDPARAAGGSSSGSASAVSSSFAMLGTGTDNCASLTMPAAYNGLATIRSTQGLVSTRGIFPSGPQDAVAGPMARSVEELALAMNTFATPDPGARFHDAQIARPDYRDHLRRDGLVGKRIGVIREIAANTADAPGALYEGAGAEPQLAFESALRRLEAAGATVVDNVSLDDFRTQRRGGGIGDEVERWLESTGGPTTFEEYCQSSRFSPWIYPTPEECLDHMQSLVRGSSRIDDGFEQYEENRRYVESEMDRLELDALVFPSDSVGWARARFRRPNCILYSASRLPAITWAATSHGPTGMPIGMSALGRAFDEKTLFEIAYAYEARYGARVVPFLGKTPDSPAYDVELFNTAKRDVARASYEDVILATGDKSALTAERFRSIARDVFEDAGYSWWTEPGD